MRDPSAPSSSTVSDAASACTIICTITIGSLRSRLGLPLSRRSVSSGGSYIGAPDISI